MAELILRSILYRVCNQRCQRVGSFICAKISFQVIPDHGYKFVVAGGFNGKIAGAVTKHELGKLLVLQLGYVGYKGAVKAIIDHLLLIVLVNYLTQAVGITAAAAKSIPNGINAYTRPASRRR